MMEAVEAEADNKGRVKGLILTIAAILLVSIVGAGGGWVVGGMLAPLTVDPAEEAAKAAEAAGRDKREKENALATARPTLLPLDPIMTNLSYPSDNWIRIEVSLEFRDQVDVRLAEVVNEDILAYLRTVSLQQIEGPRGFQYLREDLVERARLRSEGKVTDVIFRTFVIE
jgi:Flagellar basal body-associated protein